MRVHGGFCGSLCDVLYTNILLSPAYKLQRLPRGERSCPSRWRKQTQEHEERQTRHLMWGDVFVYPRTYDCHSFSRGAGPRGLTGRSDTCTFQRELVQLNAPFGKSQLQFSGSRKPPSVRASASDSGPRRRCFCPAEAPDDEAARGDPETRRTSPADSTHDGVNAKNKNLTQKVAVLLHGRARASSHRGFEPGVREPLPKRQHPATRLQNPAIYIYIFKCRNARAYVSVTR